MKRWFAATFNWYLHHPGHPDTLSALQNTLEPLAPRPQAKPLDASLRASRAFFPWSGLLEKICVAT